MSIRRLSVVVVALILCTGCARVIIEKGGVGQGYDVYRPEPYLLVFTQTTNTSETTVTDKSAGAVPPTTAPGDVAPATQPAEKAPPAGAGVSNNNGGTNSGGGGAGGAGGQGSGGGGGATAVEGLNGPGVVVIWLPDYSERYRVHSESFLAVAGAQFSIRDGWMLTSITDQSDSSTLVNAAASVLGSALGAGTGTSTASKTASGSKAIGNQTTTTITQKVQLYKFLFDPDGHFYGMGEIKLDALKLAQIRNDLDANSRLQPLRAPTFDGRQLETRDTRGADSAKKLAP